MGLIRGHEACLETLEVWPSMRSPKAKPKVIYAWLEPSKDCKDPPEATVYRGLSTDYSGRVWGPKAWYEATKTCLEALEAWLEAFEACMRILSPDLRPLKPDLRPLRPGLRHLRQTDARTHGQTHRTSIPSAPFGATAQKQLSIKKSYEAHSRNSVTQYHLNHSKRGIHSIEGFLLSLSFLESSHLLHCYMDGVFTHNPWGLHLFFFIRTPFIRTSRLKFPKK